MEKLPMCRMCKEENVRMCEVADKSLQKMYEKLTNNPFVTEDIRPMLACFLCYAKLKQMYQLPRKCQEAEKLYARMLNEDNAQKIDPGQLKFYSGLAIMPIEHVSIDGVPQIKCSGIKQEVPDDYVTQNNIELKNTLQSNELKLENLPNNSFPDPDHVLSEHTESKAEVFLSEMEFKVEVEEDQEVFKKEQGTSETQKRVKSTYDKVNVVPVYSYTGGILHPTGSPPTLAIVSAAAGGSAEPETPSSSRGRRVMKARRSLLVLNDSIAKFLADSCSDDYTGSSGDDDMTDGATNFFRSEVSRLRQEAIEREEANVVEGNEREDLGDELVVEDDVLLSGAIVKGDERINEPMELENMNEDMNVRVSGPGPNVSTVFQWTDDFTSFSGQRETYRRNPGPTFTSQDPVEIFLKIWDEDVMGLIATETNKYAREHIEQFTDPEVGSTIPKYLEQWEEVTIPVLYRYFALMICMTFCYRSTVQEYWETGLLEMPMFRQVMSRDQFLLITKFLHFVSDSECTTRGYARKIGKVAPILDHCNQKFSELYIPAQHISLDESLLLWKGRLSWRQCIRTKAARFGIKSFDLCEATTGYLLKCKLYSGKETPMHLEPLHGFANKTTQVVLELMRGYLDAGHVLVIDNWYNQLLLTRYLKSRGTDVLGTMSRTRNNVPQDLKDLKQNHVVCGDWHARHCGDIALVTWKDVKLVTVLSTYHNHEMVPGRRDGVATETPISVREYNQYVGGVDIKDQKLSMFLFESKRCHKWYMKIFKRLVNASLLNAFIIYTKSPTYRVYSHREFRRNVAEGLLARFSVLRASLPPAPVLSRECFRLIPGNHFPTYTPKKPNTNKNEHQRQDCVRCKVLKKRSQVMFMCSMCQVPLCVGKCWKEYHTRENLSIASSSDDE